MVFSFVLHAAIIATAFALIGRDWTSLVPADHLTVILASGLPEIKSLHAMDQKRQAIHGPALPSHDKAASGPYEYGAAARDKAS